jgi:hypothetical protein
MADQRIQHHLAFRADAGFGQCLDLFTAYLYRQVRQLDRVAFAHGAGIRQYVAQLPHIARPGIAQQ